jgi:hypothetical protein
MLKRDFRVTKWHRAILTLVCRFDFLTASDLYTLLGLDAAGSERENKTRYVRQALKDLAEVHRMLERWTIHDSAKQHAVIESGTPIFRPHSEFIYWLTRKGAEIIIEYDGQFPAVDSRRIDPKTQKHAHDKKSTALLPHDRERSRFFVYLERASGGAVWRRHVDLKHRFKADDLLHVLIPDDAFFFGGYFRFLEIERAQKEFERSDDTGIVDKLRKYQYYANRSERPFREKWSYMEPDGDLVDMQDFFVNVVMLTEQRKTNLLKEMNERGLQQSRFQVTSLEAYIDRPLQLLAPIWHTYDGNVHSLE